MSIWYGGDYNPEQWPREVWDEDVRLMQRGGVNLATVAVFSWARLEPRPGEYDFAWLDDVLDTLHAGGIRVDLATATASPPPWMAKQHPETLPVTEHGVRLGVGSRQQYCPSSPVYRARALRLVERMVERYAGHPALELWHVNNEYGCHVSHCYCDVSAAAFRTWLESRYGSIDELNRAWGTAFWSQRYDAFDEVEPPRAAPSFRNPTQLLDFDRFSSDELLACYRAEVEVIRAGSDVPITTNFMGFFKAVDYWEWAKHVDVVSDDTYPDPADPDSPAYAAMVRDLMRSLGGGAPWLLMEQSPSAVNWRARNAPKAPGQMRAWSFQSVARGADGILFFQWRQSKAGSEKFHSGMVPHGGTDTRVWREIEQLGGELRDLSAPDIGLEGSSVPASVAIALDWDSWWAIEQPASPTSVSYVRILFAWHRARPRSATPSTSCALSATSPPTGWSSHRGTSSRPTRRSRTLRRTPSPAARSSSASAPRSPTSTCTCGSTGTSASRCGGRSACGSRSSPRPPAPISATTVRPRRRPSRSPARCSAVRLPAPCGRSSCAPTTPRRSRGSRMARSPGGPP